MLYGDFINVNAAFLSMSLLLPKGMRRTDDKSRNRHVKSPSLDVWAGKYHFNRVSVLKADLSISEKHQQGMNPQLADGQAMICVLCGFRQESDKYPEAAQLVYSTSPILAKSRVSEAIKFQRNVSLSPRWTFMAGCLILAAGR